MTTKTEYPLRTDGCIKTKQKQLRNCSRNFFVASLLFLILILERFSET